MVMYDAMARRAAELSFASYGGDKPFEWDFCDDGTNDDGVFWALMIDADAIYVVFRGSASLQDWLRDLNCWAKPWVHSALGPVHPGFLLGIEQVAHELSDRITALDPAGHKPVILTGHSLGAARATICAGMLIAKGLLHNPLGRIVFGEPRPSFRFLADMLKYNLAQNVSYMAASERGHDRVTDLPFSFPPEEFVHATPLIAVDVQPAPGDPLGIFAWHRMSGYALALNSPA